MKRLQVFLFFLGLSSLAIAETMDKEEFIDTNAKLKACIDAGYADKDDVNRAIGTRVDDYAKAHYSKADLEEMRVVVEMRKKTTIVAKGWGCEAAFKKLMSLPVPPKS